jgi:hypothetical protein
MGRKTTTAVAVFALMFGLVATLGTGVAAAKTAPAPTVGGSVTCTIKGKLTFSPALKGLDGGTSKATVTATLTGCTGVKHRKVSITGGHLKGLVGTVTPDNCTDIAINRSIPPLSGGSVAWAPASIAATSSGISFSAGGASVVTIDGVTYLQVTYSGGSVNSGSFANSGDSEISATTTLNDAQLEDKCTAPNGLSTVDFTGISIL